jgi:hypothetical protein
MCNACGKLSIAPFVAGSRLLRRFERQFRTFQGRSMGQNGRGDIYGIE